MLAGLMMLLDMPPGGAMSDVSSDSAVARKGPLDNLTGVLALGVVVELAAIGLSQAKEVFAAVGVSVLVFLAAFAGGVFLGFLFGVPRVLSRENGAAAAPAQGAGGASEAQDELPPGKRPPQPSPVLQSNTNLERISDWLTTLLVGAALVQLGEINDLLSSFRDFIADYVKVFDHGRSAGILPAVEPLVAIFGALCGFLFMYLNTRLILIRLFYGIERLLSGMDQKLAPAASSAVRIATEQRDGGGFVGQLLARKRALSVDDALQTMFDALYREGGYRQVIDVAAALANTPAVGRPDYWFYLAAAFGQQLHHAIEEGDSAGVAAATDNALDAAARAVRLDPSYRARLWAISDPKGLDNDLQDLRKHPTFLRIVARPQQ